MPGRVYLSLPSEIPLPANTGSFTRLILANWRSSRTLLYTIMGAVRLI